MNALIRSHTKSILAAALTVAALSQATAVWAAKGDCGQPASSGTSPTASDCAFILRSAVGLNECELCVCDTNGTQSKSAADALVCLKKAVGQNVNLSCPSCGVTTTTITESSSSTSTTSTSTTSTTTTLALLCDNNADCDSLPAAFRCNPNNSFCEKPCEKTADCRDFYTCNLTTHYCEQPSLVF